MHCFCGVQTAQWDSRINFVQKLQKVVFAQNGLLEFLKKIYYSVPLCRLYTSKNTAQPPFLMIKSVFNTINIPVPRKPDFSNQMQTLTLTDKLATIGDFFLNFCGTISYFPPSFNRINHYFNIYGFFSACQNQITYHTQRLRTLQNGRLKAISLGNCTESSSGVCPIVICNVPFK